MDRKPYQRSQINSQTMGLRLPQKLYWLLLFLLAKLIVLCNRK